MTELLEKAIAEIKRLSDLEQDAIATLILEELEDEVRWDLAFEKRKMNWLRWPMRRWMKTRPGEPGSLIPTSREIAYDGAIPQSVCGIA